MHGNHGITQNQVIVNMGAHQKAIIGSMKERKLQMRAIGGGKPANMGSPGPDSSSFANTVAGVGHGFGAQRPVSRDSRVRTASNPMGRAAQKQNMMAGASPGLGAGAHKQKVNNFFSFGSGTSNAMNSSIGANSNARTSKIPLQAKHNPQGSQNSAILSQTTSGTNVGLSSSNQPKRAFAQVNQSGGNPTQQPKGEGAPGQPKDLSHTRI